ncbi:MAG: hypothetical protein JXR41_13825 [Bacteroidales bacterium]|nr:hypothetical protein [Bacteroidales bacterium]MBN2764166.1 hypothetical protein [Bacteroidales bacterium]
MKRSFFARRLESVLIFLSVIANSILAENPIITHIYITDPDDGICYLSYAGNWPETIEYATSDNSLGSFTHRSRLNDSVSSSTNHQSIVKFRNQWYFIYHTADLPEGGNYRKSVAIDYLFYNPDGDGTLLEVFRTKEGVAHTDSTSLCSPLPIKPVLQVNDEGWREKREVEISEGDSIIFSPAVADEGTWIWKGPGEFADSIQQVTMRDVVPDQSGNIQYNF